MPMAWANGGNGRRRSRGTLCHGMTRTQEPRDAPRVRDLPAPRRAQGFIGPLFRKVFAWPYRLALAGLYRAGFRPWQLTMLSLIANVVIGWLLIDGRFFVSGVLLIVAGLFDIFDGGVARLRGEDGPAGAFLDSVLDRVSDIILFGCLFWALAGQGHRTAAALALISLVAALLVSYIRAEAESVGLALTEGMMQRLERYVALMIGLMFPGALLPVLVVLSVLGAVTVLQRVASAWRQLPPTAARAVPGQKE
jgi:CDP-diacylglycerol--glycerol-3-phosphate 3-phosphatidyltransferase